MKRFFITLLVCMTIVASGNAQEQKTTTVTVHKDTISVVKEQSAKTDSAAVDTTKADKKFKFKKTKGENVHVSFLDFDDGDFGAFGTFGKTVVSILAITLLFGTPLFIVFVIFYFRYKSRKARYRLAEQALVAGKPLPEGILKETRHTEQTDYQTQGIKQTFTGVGLFIFLWGITGEFGVGAIGLLVMFMGIGRWYVGNKQQKGSETQNKEEK